MAKETFQEKILRLANNRLTEYGEPLTQDDKDRLLALDHNEMDKILERRLRAAKSKAKGWS